MNQNSLPKIKLQHFKNLFRKDKLKEYLHRLVSLKLPTKEIATSIAIGIFIGTLIPIGLQTVVLIPIVLLFRKNLLLSFLATLISNPITVIPFYLTAYSIGSLFINTNNDWHFISKIIENGDISSFISLGSETVVAIYLGLIIMALVLTPLTYFISYTAVDYLRSKKKLNYN